MILNIYNWWYYTKIIRIKDVKIKDVAKRHKQFKEIWEKPFEEKSLKEFEKSCWQDLNQVIH